MALELPSWAVVAFNYVGLPWPGIDEDQLRAWAQSVRGFANQVTDNSGRTHQAVAALADTSESSFANSVAAQWEHHNQLITDLHGPMNDFADALDIAADAVVAQKWAVIVAACALAGEFVGTQIGAIFTLGADETALPGEIEATKWLVKLALEELEAELIGKLANIAAQAISDHLNRFVANLFSDALPVAMEVQAVKISYAQLRDTASTIRGHATETEDVGKTAYHENANRDLEDPGEGSGGRWPVVAVVKQVLESVAVDMFQTLIGAIFRAQEGTASILMNLAQKFEDDDTSMAADVPQPAISGDPAAPGVSSPGAVTDSLPAGKGSGEPRLAGVSDAPGAPDAVTARTGAGDPVDVATGDVILAETDVTLPGVLPLVIERTHRSSWRAGRWFGRSWLTSFDQRLLITEGRIVGAFADGRVLTWTYPNGADAEAMLPLTGPMWPLRRNRDGSYQVTDPQRGLTWRFEHRAGYDAGTGEEGELPLVSLTDRIGHEIVFNYDAAGQPASVTHSGGYRIEVTTSGGHVTGLILAGRDGSAEVPLVSYEYDADENLAAVINSSGLPLKFSYDTEGRLSGWLDRNGHYYLYAYDSRGRCVRGEGPGGAMSGTFAYEPGITRFTDAAGAVTTYELTDSAHVAAITDPLGNVTRWEHDTRGRITTRVDPLDRVIRYAYDDRGNLLTITRPDGSQSTAEYDDHCQPVVLTGPDGTEWRQRYDAHGNRTQLVAPDGAVTTYEHDGSGHLAAATGPDGTVTTVVCDAAGLQVAETRPDGRSIGYERDQFGRITRVSGWDGTVTELTWTVEGQPASRTLPDGQTEAWTWDPDGNLTSYVSPAEAVTACEYGPFGKPAAVVWPDRTRTEFTYDSALRLTQVSHGGLAWRYEYDSAGRLAAETDFNGAVTRYSRDAAGQLIRKVNAAGQELSYDYDALGNMTSVSADGAVTTFGYDPAGRLIGARNAGAEVVISRDLMGQVVAETCDDRTVMSAYDAAGRIIRRVTPSGIVTDWSYDPSGRLAAMSAGSRELRFGYDPGGREISRELPGELTLTQGWDARGRLATQVLTRLGASEPADLDAPGQPLQRRAYEYSPDGLLAGVEDMLVGNRAFGLDAVGRVTAVTGNEWAEQYSYDPVGNVTTATWPAVPSGTGGGWLDAGPQGLREVTGTTIGRAGNLRYRYDAAGRVVRRTRIRISRKPETWQYTWDAANRLTAVTTPDGTTWRYRYDPFGRRIAKQHVDANGQVLAETRFSWDRAVLVEQAELTTTGEQVTTWDYRPGTFAPLTQQSHTSLRDAPQEQIDQQFYAIITDLTGTPSELVAPDGTLAGYQQHTLWGGTLWQPAGASTPLRFPGQYADPETGLHYNNQRYYDPVTGSYLSPDPLGLTPAPNPHAYVPNPHVLIDPLGLNPGSPPAAAGDAPTLFRGTSEGFAGSPGLQAAGVTPASTDPVVGTIFATHAEQFGPGVLHIASSADLTGVKILPGNVLSGLEREVAADITPTEFAARASTTIPAADARSILNNMGYSIPGSIATPAGVQAALENTSRMSAAEIAAFIRQAGGKPR